MPGDFSDDVAPAQRPVVRHVHRDIRGVGEITPDMLNPEMRAIYDRATRKPVPKVYIIGSLRNPKIPQIGKTIRDAGFDVFDDWHSVGPECDDKWKEYEVVRGRSYLEALSGYHAEHAFNFDLKHILEARIGILALPAGKSGHMEFGMFCHRENKRGYVLFEEEPAPDRFDLMYKLANGLFFDIDKLIEHMRREHL